jgi:hypothetical protein
MAEVGVVMERTPAGKMMMWGETLEELVEGVHKKTPGTSQMITGQLKVDMVGIPSYCIASKYSETCILL